MDGHTRIWRLRHVVTHYVNPLLRPLAGRLPAFGIITHQGRKTGRTYRTPINVFRSGDVYLFFLTYGSGAEWVKNVLAAGSCSLRTRGRDVPLIEPVLITDPELRLAPRFVRFVGRLVHVTEILRMRSAPERPKG